MDQVYSKEQIQEIADARLNQHKPELSKGKPFSFEIEIGKRKYNVSYQQDDEGIWKFTDFKEA
ncbi:MULTISPECIES: hypothetical protein [Olivibacter]|jgi:hypothetical protein|uniref:Uncharacterized protein n=3 Tax=Sphingobacteriaceae TaxID=84566 RepID=F4C5G6_SPHS2|nr:MULTISPECIES: hypothetical protein [Olivibacter]MCL4640356.1 hypothetical protein [Olivibacter sp. UJ_SKK_5.1]MDM8174943.1 hypothetical protein [Olivibacter sp. 47]MDX3913378.1 hypothetical protein [Pseudosphingobacterium sp.]QEL01727.1 hypothetical protein FKG96_13200 [Olivibacter sp. LS-1]